MELTPAFWRQPCFRVREVADLIGVDEGTLRTWLARAVVFDFIGRKSRGRIYMSARDAFYWLIVRDLIGTGMACRTAMLAAASHAYAQPARYLIATRDGARSTLESSDALPDSVTTSVVIPLSSHLEALLRQAGEIYAQDDTDAARASTESV